MRTSTQVCIGLLIAGAIVFLLQLWFNVMPDHIFAKFMITDGVLCAVIYVVAFLVRENKQTDDLNKHNELD